jgi:hypothetical protein
MRRSNGCSTAVSSQRLYRACTVLRATPASSATVTVAARALSIRTRRSATSIASQCARLVIVPHPAGRCDASVRRMVKV